MSRIARMVRRRMERKRSVVVRITGGSAESGSRLPKAHSERRGRGWKTRGIVVEGTRRRSGRQDTDIFGADVAVQPAGVVPSN